MCYNPPSAPCDKYEDMIAEREKAKYAHMSEAPSILQKINRTFHVAISRMPWQGKPGADMCYNHPLSPCDK